MITWGTAAATLTGPLVFLLPGWALLSLLLPPERFEPEHRPDVASWLLLAAGLTLALTPVGLLLLHLVGLRIGPGVALAYLALSAIIVTWRRGPHCWAWLRRPVSWREKLVWLDAPLLALALAAVAIVGVRLWVVRGLNVGFWGDSYQHTMIVQLILDNGGLFQSWEPYAPLQSFTYHFGFHGNVALFQWATARLTGLATPRAVVLISQFLNALAALALYPLAVRLSGGRRWVGVGAVLVAGLLTPMPMFYINWGRFTQLAGQTILPVTIWLTLEAMESRRRDPQRLVLAILAVAGLALTHYFVALFCVVFLIPYLLVWMVQYRGRWRDGLLRIAIIGAGSALLVLPWAIVMLRGLLPRLLTSFVQSAIPKEHVEQENLFYPLAQFLPHYVAVAAGLGGLWALLQRRKAALLLVWVGCLFLVSNPHWLGLPGTGVVNNFAVELSLYIPASILAADLVVSIFEFGWRRMERLRPVLGLAATAMLVSATWFGIQARKDVIATQYQLVTPADEEALAWVRANTPPDAKFLINAISAYGGGLVAGSDAGWWLPLLAGRQNTVPPLNYGGELGPVPDYIAQVNSVTHYFEENALEDVSTVEYLKAQGITHVFVGEQGGPLLDPVVLQSSPYYRPVYTPPGEAQGPWVFEVILP